MQSQRKLKRVHLIAALDVLHPETDRILGVVLDINEEGLAIRARQSFVVGSQYMLKILLPMELQGMQFVQVVGRCAWCRPSDNPDLSEAGFELVDVAPDVVEVIEQLIRRYRR